MKRHRRNRLIFMERDIQKRHTKETYTFKGDHEHKRCTKKSNLKETYIREKRPTYMKRDK